MQFSTSMVVLFLTAAAGVTAKHHNQLQCTTASGNGQFIFAFPASFSSAPFSSNDDVTKKVCPGFCSDCSLGDKDGHKVCNSPTKQMDGDGFSNACIKAGATGSR
ncbi:hypothetical protein C8035_v011537 [Colletotrichum spinosum]|uniref:Uncharacterized protein n=1 Tax=Colletotrichum spinosum TaxID=1347390 RepID=A0A4R8Q547_9PEZI|nr:hypothetical protein C8035_v011537 [Colletotrichum spinosum]